MIFQSKNKYKYGFTLSEVLVTLAMMGILGSILIPVILEQQPNANKVMLKKQYMVFERAVSKLINDDTLYPASQTTTLDGKTVSKGFNYTDDPTGLKGSQNKFCYHLADSLNLIDNPVCTDDGNWKTAFTLADGATWELYTKADSSPNTQFPVSSTDSVAYVAFLVIDVNGDKPPNCTSVSGVSHASVCSITGTCGSNPDKFSFGIRFDGKIDVGGYRGGGKISDKCAESILSAPLSNK